MKRFLPFVALAPLLLGQAGRTPLLSVTAVHHASLADATRVTVEVSGAFEFHWDRLHDPERVYYDILGAEPRFGDRRSYTEEPVDRLVQRIRVAETAPGVTRVVLLLAGPAEITASQLAAPNRLVIELRPGPAAPPSTAAVAPPAGGNAASAGRGGDSSKTAPQTAPPPPAPPPVDVPKAATRTASGQSSLTRALGLKIERVVIDPGHGGHDEGCAGPHGLLEKDLALDVGLRVGALIEVRMGSQVIYTRTDDTFVPLEERTALANDQKADLFLSIHANFSSTAAVSGIESFYLNVTGTKYAMDVAARENASSQKSVFELADLVQKIARQDKAQESRDFAQRVQAALYAFSARNLPGAKNRGVKSAPFVVLIGAHMPSILTEVGFLSNPKEEALLKKTDYRQKLAEAIFRGVSRYADSLSHFQPEPAPVAKSAAPAATRSPE